MEANDSTDSLNPKLPIDPRLQAVDDRVAEVVFEEFQRNSDLVGIHLRDARNMLSGARQAKDDRLLSKGALILATAALESNLIYLSGIALRIAENKTNILLQPQIRYLRGVEEIIDENGVGRTIALKQSLAERLQVVPSLLARTVQRTYRLRNSSAAFRKLAKTIERRDAIVHPRWDRYVAELGWWEAAEAIDAVELYLESVSSALHPYLFHYFPALYTIPGNDHHEVAVGHRTLRKRGPVRKISTMANVGLREVLTREWMDAVMAIRLALGHGCEGDSGGSMLTRAALVLLYAMLDAQLSVVSQWRLREKIDEFTEAEVLFLNEYAVGIGHDGEVWIDDEHQSFKKRIKAVPVILSRRIDRNEQAVDLSKQWGKDLLDGQALRNRVMHSPFGEALPRVPKEELVRFANAVFEYFQELATKMPTSFQHLPVLLKVKPDLRL